jgi:hypothetical protein
VREVARRYRVGPDRVRGWIKSGEMRALNTGMTLCGRPRYVVTPEALAEWEQSREVQAPVPKAMPRRRRRSSEIDYYPD